MERARPNLEEGDFEDEVGAESHSCHVIAPTMEGASSVAKMNNTHTSGPTLPLFALDGGLRHLQSANSLRQSAFVQRLRTGASISIGVLGASVAQQGGCLDQPGERCMLYSRKGYFVRLLRYINATWPHPLNALHNGAIDAAPAQSFITCLMPLLPVAPPQLLLLEFGSMARSIDLPRTELLIRRLLALPSQPLLLFVTVREWCDSPHIWFNSKRNVSAKSLFSKHTYAQGAETLYAKAEATFERFCLHYDLSCVSYYGALARGFYRGWPGFELAAIAADCLHPAKGRHGGAYMTQLLEHWTRRVMAAADSTVKGMSASPTGAREHAAASSIMPTEPPRANLAPRPLPAPLLPEARRALRMPHAKIEPDRCWGFGPVGAHGKHFRYARLQMVPWRTAYCATADLPFERCEFRCDQASCAQLCPAVHPGEPSYPEAAAVPPTVTSATAPHSSSTLSLPVWTHCLYALGQSSVRGRRPKRSEGALALRPGASIEVPLDITRAHNASGAVACAELSYLTSYEHMGVASVSCVRGCACDSRRIDAHRPPDTHQRNVSVFSQLRLTLRLSPRGHTQPMPPQSTTTTEEEEEEEEEAVREVDAVCWLRVRVLDDSSSGGGHKFKLRMATVAIGAACAVGKQSSRSTVP